ncbi:hypothetical protein VOLCADRAFT_107898 [Volvox carteri f. nagariensis]|uniref:Uncharacterized protein n=1 Tax=Volvox carteri f. nagariensis TaxID=3068 RepID=D8UH29_VOLCA|nr:uncharacterized protein VOLCADRAFT_107898 [Volvox carteri f. nagariensis]EFJ41001.1 hypothetical protein VOLCADRAFT_107898 [Volvox carteri f. nagariensis]|eukprot:XP_002957975.1 hypothetical protein VOLCADRAFT_107898 [Volvox carteri f. nagariensis]
MVGEKRRPACLPEPACYLVRPFQATVLFRIGNQQAADGLAWVTLAPRLTQRNIPRASKLKAGLSQARKPKFERVTDELSATALPCNATASCASSSVTLPRATDPIPATASKQVVQQYQPPGWAKRQHDASLSPRRGPISRCAPRLSPDGEGSSNAGSRTRQAPSSFAMRELATCLPSTKWRGGRISPFN